MSPSDFKPAPLFGGAMTSDVPSDWINVSELLQVLDHQKVFVDDTHVDDDDGLDQERPCLVVEILEYQTDQTDDQVSQYLFEDLADANGATEQDFRGFDSDIVGLRTSIGYNIHNEDNNSNDRNGKTLKTSIERLHKSERERERERERLPSLME